MPPVDQPGQPGVDDFKPVMVNSTGLGLFLAKSLAEKLGHHLYVESTLGEGTSFQLLFPNLTYFSEENEDFMLHKKSY